MVAASLAAIVVLGYCLIVNAGNLAPAGPPAPTMKTLNEVEPRIAINSDNTPGDGSYEYIISSSGSYYLTGDLTGDGTTTKGGISIAADDVTIDLMGYTLKGSDSGINYGILMNTRSNVEIRNGTVRDFHYGIYESGSNGQGHRIINVRAVSNVLRGIYLFGKDHLVKNCTASDNGDDAASTVYGIYAYNGSTVTGNTAHNNGDNATGNVYGIYAFFGCTVTGNTAYNNGYNAGTVYGIYLGAGSTVTGNTAYNNGDWANGNVYGIYLVGNSLVDQNTAYSNGTSAGSATQIRYGVTGCVYGINVPAP